MTRNIEGEGAPETSDSGLPARDGYGSGGSPVASAATRSISFGWTRPLTWEFVSATTSTGRSPAP
jgi:hypothetical protein